MTLIISSGEGKAERIDPSGFEKEDRLQEYIHNHPESIPLYEVKEDINLLILAREFQTNSGPIDALAVDKQGDLYIIETKLYENRTKREVLAQSLDYGASLWKHSGDFSTFKNDLDKHAHEAWNTSLTTKLKDHFGIDDEELAELFSAMENNLDDGILKFVVLMDSLDDRLKDLVLFVNQNSQFDVYAVEMKHYQHEEYEIMLPNLFGAEVKKNVSGSSSTSNRKEWDEESFFADLEDKTTEETQKAVEELYQYCKNNADEIGWGTGSARGSFIPRFKDVTDGSLFAVYSDGSIRMQYGYAADNKAAQQNLYERVSNLFDVRNADKTSHFVDSDTWIPKKGEFVSIIENICKKHGS